MTYLFIGNSASPLAIDRFRIIESVSNLECYFFDKQKLVVMDRELVEINHLPLVVSMLLTIPYVKKIYHLIAFSFLCWICLKKKVLVIHFHGVSAQLLCLIKIVFKAIKIVATPQGSDINQNFRGVHRYFTKYLLDSADIVTVKSRFMRDRVNQISKPKQVIDLNWGVDYAFESWCVKKIEVETITILSPRTNKPNYNIEMILTAVERLKKLGRPIYFICISLQKSNVQNNGVVDEIHHNINYSEMARVLSRSDIMISIPTNDGFSTSIMEALSLGVYPVISDINAYKGEFLGADSLLSRVKINVDDLTAELDRLCSDIVSIRAGRQARISYGQKEFSRKAQIEKISKILSAMGVA